MSRGGNLALEARSRTLPMADLFWRVKSAGTWRKMAEKGSKTGSKPGWLFEGFRGKIRG